MGYSRSMPPNAPQRGSNAFTLLELILSMTVLTAIVAILVQVMSGVQRVWRGGTDDAATARAAFIALDRIAADLSAAAQAPLPRRNDAMDEESDENDGARAPILVIRPSQADKAPLPPENLPEDISSESGATFSRVAVLCRSARPVWTDDESTLRPLRLPPRSANSETALLRGLLRVRYDVVPHSETTDATPEESPTQSIAFSLVRSVAGVTADDTAVDASGGDPWWKRDDIPETGFGVSEVVARNVVWFGVTVPDFLGIATNETGTAVEGFHVWGDYAALPESVVGLDPETIPQPLPPLVDVVLGLVSDQTLSRAEAQTDAERREAILRQGLHVYVRRVLLQ